MDQVKWTHRRHSLLLLLTLLAAWPVSATLGQERRLRGQRSKAPSYAFVSPNTRENLTLEEAISALNSPEERQLIAEALVVACRLRQSLSIEKAVGSWSDGAEHSTVIRARTNEPALRYAASWLGKLARQKAVLYFRPGPAGASRMYVLALKRSRQDIANVAANLEANGIKERTLVPRKQRLLVYVVDLKDELRTRVLTTARRLRARLSSVRGAGQFIGDDDRDKAQAVFEQEIVKFESTHPRSRRACRTKTSTMYMRLPACCW